MKLLRYVIMNKVVERAGCTVCPACLRETPVKHSICLLCKGMMVSRGRRPFELKEEEEEEDENDDEQMEVDVDDETKQEPTAEDEMEYKDAVDKGLQEADAYRLFSFDETEVDFGDEDEEQDVEMTQAGQEESEEEEEEGEMQDGSWSQRGRGEKAKGTCRTDDAVPEMGSSSRDWFKARANRGTSQRGS